MKFLMVSQHGGGLPLLKRISDEGHDCTYWMPNIARNWREEVDDETVVIFDSPGSGKSSVGIKNVWGTGAVNDVMQFDLEFGFNIAKIHQLKMPPETDEPVEGCEVFLQAWYVNGEIVPNSLFSTIEHDGSAVGWFWPPKKKRDTVATATIYRHTLNKLVPFLKTNQYSGPLTVRTVIGKNDGLAYFFGFETGFRFPSFYTQVEVIDGWGELIAAMASGEIPELPVRKSIEWIGYFWSGAVHVTGRDPDIGALKDSVKKTAEQIRIGHNKIQVTDIECEEAVELMKHWKYM